MHEWAEASWRLHGISGVTWTDIWGPWLGLFLGRGCLNCKNICKANERSNDQVYNSEAGAGRVHVWCKEVARRVQ